MNPGSPHCANHPKVAATLSCCRCAKPICPDCGVPGPTGLLCYDCAGVQRPPTETVSPFTFVNGLLVAVAVGAAVSGAFLYMPIIFFMFAFLGGLMVTQAVVRVTRCAPGADLAYMCGGGVLAGALIAVYVTGRWAVMLEFPLFLLKFILVTTLTYLSAIGKLNLW